MRPIYREALGSLLAAIFFTLTCLSPLALASCAPREKLPEEIAAENARALQVKAADDERAKIKATAAQHVANLDPIGQVVGIKGLVPEGLAVRSEAAAIGSALGLTAADMPIPRQTVEQWLKDGEAARATLQTDRDRLASELAQAKAVNSALDERAIAAEAKAKTAAAAADSTWGTIRNSAITGGIALVAINALSLVNGPAGSIARMFASAIIPGAMAAMHKKVAAAEEENGTLVTAVAGADVAREGLAVLDSKLAANPQAQKLLTGVIGDVTGHQVGSLQDYFKTLAGQHASDAGQGDQVSALLDTLRHDTIETQGGVPTSLVNILTSLQTTGVAHPV